MVSRTRGHPITIMKKNRLDGKQTEWPQLEEVIAQEVKAIIEEKLLGGEALVTSITAMELPMKQRRSGMTKATAKATTLRIIPIILIPSTDLIIEATSIIRDAGKMDLAEGLVHNEMIILTIALASTIAIVQAPDTMVGVMPHQLISAEILLVDIPLTELGGTTLMGILRWETRMGGMIKNG